MRFLLVFFIVFLMLPCLPSCTDNTVQPEKVELSIFEQPAKIAAFEDDARVIRQNIRRAHNGPILRYYGKKDGKIGEKLQLEDFRKIFVESYNEEFMEMGLDFQMTNADFDYVLAELKKFCNDIGIDFTRPETITSDEAFDKLASKGYITQEEARQIKRNIKLIKEGVNPYVDERGMLTATLPSDNVKLATDIADASIPLWTVELLEMYPELGWSWSDIDWDAVLYKISLYTCDIVGGIGGGLIGLPGGATSIIGAALGAGMASLAFELAIILLVEEQHASNQFYC